MIEFTVKDLLKLDIMKNFKVVAGNKGMDKCIKEAEILDFEFTKGAHMGRESIFNGESIVLTSLLFARDHPEQILDAVIRLKEFNVSVMAYKAAFFDELPREVIDYANRENFTILKFGGDEFFDRIIFDIMSAVTKDEEESNNTLKLRRLMDPDTDRKQVRSLSYEINPDFKKYAMAVSVKNLDEDITEQAIFSEVGRRIREKTAVIKYGESFMLILTQEENSLNKFNALLEDMYAVYDLARGNVVMGQSSVRQCRNDLDLLVKEALCSRFVAEITGEKEKRFGDIGVYQIIAFQMGEEPLSAFTDSRMQVIFDLDKGGDGNFLTTAIAYVNSEGDVNKTAETTFCHKNTVRYRLGKIQEKLGLAHSDKEFYQELSFAVKSYLFREKMEEYEE